MALDDEAVRENARLAQQLRAAGHYTLFGYQRRNPGKGLREADRAGARFAALRGEGERERGVWQLKELASGEQRELDASQLAQVLETGTEQLLGAP